MEFGSSRFPGQIAAERSRVTACAQGAGRAQFEGRDIATNAVARLSVAGLKTMWVWPVGGKYFPVIFAWGPIRMVPAKLEAGKPKKTHFGPSFLFTLAIKSS